MLANLELFAILIKFINPTRHGSYGVRNEIEENFGLVGPPHKPNGSRRLGLAREPDRSIAPEELSCIAV